MIRSRVFKISFVAAFALSVVTSLWVFHALHPRRARVVDGSLAEWAVPDVKSPTMAKAEHLFWVGRIATAGQVAVDGLGSRKLFSSLFPGYPEAMRLDSELWNDYFSRDFDAKVSSALLSSGSEYGNTVYYSWTGCLDIFRKYGADVVVFGASEVAQSIAPDLLSKFLSASALPPLAHPRILMCTGAAAAPEVVGELAKEMIRLSELVGKPRWVIYGYPATAAYTESSTYETTVLGKMNWLNAYRRNQALGRFAPWNRPVLFPWSWNDLLPLRHVSEHLPFALATRRRDEAAHFGRWSVLPRAIDPDWLRDTRALKTMLSAQPFRSPFLEGVESSSCGFTAEASARLGTTVRTLKSLSGHVLLYLSPSTGDDLAITPPCYSKAVRTIFQNQSGPGILVKTQGAESYGLDYPDFVFGSPTTRALGIDSVHPNIQGARKITAALASEIISAERKGGRN